ncbi:MAG TPA: hypothetical protein VHX59_09265 [Mycobacteriales bacterium]|nr:hypothetical protein [Mycobacteriales bacterium]
MATLTGKVAMLGLWIIIGVVVLVLAGAALLDRSTKRRGQQIRGKRDIGRGLRDYRMDAQAKDPGHNDLNHGGGSSI